VRAVFNTSPLIVLTKLGYIHGAISLFDDVFVPFAVWEEINRKEDEVSSAIHNLTIQGAVKIMKAQTVRNLAYPGLHMGEIEAIALAKETASLVVLDDLKARKAARLEGLRVIGTLGILRILKENGFIGESSDELFKKIMSIGFRITPELFYMVMGEER